MRRRTELMFQVAIVNGMENPGCGIKGGYCQPWRVQASAPVAKCRQRPHCSKSAAERENCFASQMSRIRMQDGGDDVSGSLFVTGNPRSQGFATCGNAITPS
jgi:hypothetical protein